MAPLQTLGAAIEAVCMHQGWQDEAWDFLFVTVIPVERHWTPDGIGVHAEDQMTIYCSQARDTD